LVSGRLTPIYASRAFALVLGHALLQTIHQYHSGVIKMIMAYLKGAVLFPWSIPSIPGL
jgi:hypothetical protein